MMASASRCSGHLRRDPQYRTNGLFLSPKPFVVHTVNHEQYGTFFETIGARDCIGQIGRAAEACGALR